MPARLRASVPAAPPASAARCEAAHLLARALRKPEWAPGEPTTGSGVAHAPVLHPLTEPRRGPDRSRCRALAPRADSRLAIFRLLVQAGPPGLPAGQIGERLGLAPATLSFHLKTLRAAGLVEQRRDGRSLIYAADFARMQALLGPDRTLLPGTTRAFAGWLRRRMRTAAAADDGEKPQYARGSLRFYLPPAGGDPVFRNTVLHAWLAGFYIFHKHGNITLHPPRACP